MHRKNYPEVSVVLLSYNRPRCLEESLSSLIHQSYENVKIAVVDNPSPSSDEVASIVSRHAKVRLIQNATNLGYTGGMNRGLKDATGEYVFLTEDDIVLDKDCIQCLVKHMDEVSSVNLVASGTLQQDSQDHSMCGWRVHPWRSLSNEDLWRRRN